MIGILFDYEGFQKYWNCNFRSIDQWTALGNPSWIIGLLYFSFGMVYLIITIPASFALLKSDLLKYSAYKIMAFLSLVDIMGLLNGTFYCSYASIVGMIYCMNPTLNYVMGIWAYTSWTTGSSTCVLLAASRCIHFVNPNIGKMLFARRKAYLWLIVPTLYAFYSISFANTCVFNSNMYAFSFDPFVGLPERNGSVDLVHYPRMSLLVHNMGVPIVLTVIYVTLCLSLLWKMKNISVLKKITKPERNMLIQAMFICCVVLVDSLAYVYMNFFPVDQTFIILTQVGWMSIHGLPGITYMIFNKSICNDVFKVFRKPFGGSVTPMPNVPRSDNNNSSQKYSSSQRVGTSVF